MSLKQQAMLDYHLTGIPMRQQVTNCTFHKDSGRIVGVQIENLNSLCLTVDCGMDTLFVCNFPNAFEKD